MKLLRAIDVHLVDVKEVVRTCRKTGISEILSNLIDALGCYTTIGADACLVDP